MPADEVTIGSAPCPRCGGPHGRPVVLPGLMMPHVSLATAGPLVAVAVTDAGPVGVDVERVLRAEEPGFVDVALHPDEDLPDGPEAATRLWVRKEAVLKAAGVGLLVDPASVLVSPPGEPARLLDWPRRPRGVDRAYLPLPRPADVLLLDVVAPDGYAAAVALLRRT